MVFDKTLKLTVNIMNSESTNVVYSITCMKCLVQYLGSEIKFKSGFRIHKSDIKTKKDTRHFNNEGCNSSNPFVYLCVQDIVKVYCIRDDCNVTMKIFYGREENIGSPNYLQMQNVWTVFLTYTLLNKKVAQNTNFVTRYYCPKKFRDFHGDASA